MTTCQGNYRKGPGAALDPPALVRRADSAGQIRCISGHFIVSTPREGHGVNVPPGDCSGHVNRAIMRPHRGRSGGRVEDEFTDPQGVRANLDTIEEALRRNSDRDAGEVAFIVYNRSGASKPLTKVSDLKEIQAWLDL